MREMDAFILTWGGMYEVIYKTVCDSPRRGTSIYVTIKKSLEQIGWYIL